MDRDIKKTSKLLSKRWFLQDVEKHHFRMQSAKSKIDTSSPKTQTYIQQHKLPYQPFADLRQHEIDRGNKALLVKLQSIVDQKFKQNFDAIKQIKRKSLVRNQIRQTKLTFIAKENQKILKRIQSQKASLDVNVFHKERIQQQKLLQCICEFPYQFANQPSLKILHSPRQQSKTPTQQTQIICRKIDAISTSVSRLQEDRIIVFKKGIQLNKGEFIVEISTNQDSMFIAAHEIQSTKAYVLEIPMNQALKLVHDIEGKYEILAQRLKIVKNNLILKLPVINVSHYTESFQYSSKKKQYFSGTFIFKTRKK